jgi:hypothetical protein
MLVTVALFTISTSSIRAQEERTWSSLEKIKPFEPDAKDDELRKLQKLRFNEALAEVKEATLLYEEGLGAGTQALEIAFQASNRMLESAIELYPDPKEQLNIYEGHLTMAKLTEEIVSERTERGKNQAVLFHRAVGNRLNAEITLLKARRNLENAKKAASAPPRDKLNASDALVRAAEKLKEIALPDNNKRYTIEATDLADGRYLFRVIFNPNMVSGEMSILVQENGKVIEGM